jgi:hypothetical protein
MAFNPMQVQAALQNPVRFPDNPTLQNYAQGIQPTGQVTPQMAGQELVQRGAERQAFQRQGAMQNDPRNKPPVLAEKIMQLQQMEQALGMQAAMLAKKEQDISARQQGIGALPTRPDMFTAMDGGIVFSGGGGVLGFKKGGNRGEMDSQDAVRPLYSISESVEADAPSTTGTSTGKLDPIQEILAASRRITESGGKAMLSETGKKELRDKRIAEMAAEFGEYEKGRSGREARMAEALRGQKPELIDFLGAMAAGGPKRTLGETLSAMVPGTQKIRAEQQAREMAASKYLAEAEEKAAQAALAEKRGQRAAADKLIQEAQADRLKAFEIQKGVEDTGIRALTSVAQIQSKAELAEADRAFREKLADAERKYKEERDKNRNELLLAQIEAKLARAGVPSTDLQARASVAYEVLKEDNARLSPDQRKSDAKLRNEAFGLAENALYGSRRTSAAASMLRAEVFNSKTLSEAMGKLRYDPVYNEASAEDKRQMENEVRARFPASGAMPSGAIPYPQRSNTPPPPPGFVPNSR